ncbi:MAG: NAD-dependent epimerase/dehydratase family protein [Roseiflexaceae bacterium]|nr:NAD-dependent epimerase/dehydratase family protein [Roseiflexaceae bacterium]
MQVLVTGGTGFLGSYLARALLAQGHQVRLLGRNFAPVQHLLAQGAIALPADLRDRAAVVAACAGADVVYHAGAKSEPWGRRADFHAINVGGTAHVIAGCQAHAVRRLVYISSPSVIFTGRDQHLLAEAQPYPRRFTSVYAHTKKLGEDLVNQAIGLETVIIRPKALFGPGDTALLPRLISAARAGRLPLIGDGRNQVDLSYVENVADALVLALDAPRAVGNTYTITNGEHVRLWDVIFELLQALGLSTQLRRIPLALALVAAGAMELRAAASGQEPLLTRYTAAILARTQTYDITAARRDLGYNPRVSVAEGVARTLAAVQQNRRTVEPRNRGRATPSG